MTASPRRTPRPRSANVTGTTPLVHVHRRVRELEAAQRAALQLLDATSPDEVMLVAVRVIADSLRAPRVRLYTWDDLRSTLRAVCLEGSGVIVDERPAPSPRVGPPARARAARNSAVDERSGNLMIPLVAGSEQLALVVVDRSSAHRFEHEDLAVADELAALAGRKLRNILRTHELEARARQARDAEQVKSEFLNLASHELRGPLTVLMGYVSLLEDGAFGPVPEAFMGTMPVINARLSEMEGLINAMLETSRLEDGQLRLDLAVTDLREVVDDAVRRCELFVHPGQRLGLRCPDGPVQVNVDRERMLTVVSNLVHNAIKYSVQHTDVYCGLSVDGDVATVAVRDTGIGIAADDMDTLFTRFGRIRSNPDSRSVPGTGLGLYLSRELTRAHGGDIVVESSPGEGSVFTVVLPLAG
ncbi:MAG: GAF domain-containing sensor histidine kinase [Candidatus Dormibacteraeota bacterium]|nr:GAF domain-containing sensor histidine kinase [Candidatus Dormibacteraeota bacterium]